MRQPQAINHREERLLPEKPPTGLTSKPKCFLCGAELPHIQTSTDPPIYEVTKFVMKDGELFCVNCFGGELE